jgi:hypothetical protein
MDGAGHREGSRGMKWVEMVLPLAFIAIWIVLQAVVLPRFGVST